MQMDVGLDQDGLHCWTVNLDVLGEKHRPTVIYQRGGIEPQTKPFLNPRSDPNTLSQ